MLIPTLLSSHPVRVDCESFATLTDSMTAITQSSDLSIKSGVCGKILLVTGAASGIGLATAKLFYSSGAKVVIADVGERRLKNAAASIGPECRSRLCDVTSWPQMVDLFQWTVDTLGTPEIIFCNAGIDPEMALLAADATDEGLRGKVALDFLADEADLATGKLLQPSHAIFDINYFGVMYGVKLGVHHLRNSGKKGRIIVTGSSNSYMAIPSSNMYDASKHAVLGLMRSTSQRQDVINAGITLSMLCPSLTATPMTAGIPGELTAGLASSSAADVAVAVAYMASAPAEDVNGSVINVKGTKLREVEGGYKGWMYPIFSG